MRKIAQIFVCFSESPKYSIIYLAQVSAFLNLNFCSNDLIQTFWACGFVNFGKNSSNLCVHFQRALTYLIIFKSKNAPPELFFLHCDIAQLQHAWENMIVCTINENKTDKSQDMIANFCKITDDLSFHFYNFQLFNISTTKFIYFMSFLLYLLVQSSFQSSHEP